MHMFHRSYVEGRMLKSVNPYDIMVIFCPYNLFLGIFYFILETVVKVWRGNKAWLNSLL